MKTAQDQQIVISGVGGQGVLFVTRILAEAAIAKGLSVLTSETHGMAQRGGTVLSHLKVGTWTSPLIRLGQADGLLALKAENLAAHGAFLAPSGWTVVNDAVPSAGGRPQFSVDADTIAANIGNSRSVNLVMLGAALARTREPANAVPLFCDMDDIRGVLDRRLNGRTDMHRSALRALDAGFKA
jgi:indolepyruvate ferredoxin oxidoreductase, beta subunit